MSQKDWASPQDAVQEMVLKALSNPKYRWRTIEGVAKETGLDPGIVRAAIAQAIGNTVVEAPVPSASGAPLFSTREHVLETATFGQRLAGAFKNRVF